MYSLDFIYNRNFIQQAIKQIRSNEEHSFSLNLKKFYLILCHHVVAGAASRFVVFTDCKWPIRGAICTAPRLTATYCLCLIWNIMNISFFLIPNT